MNHAPAFLVHSVYSVYIFKKMQKKTLQLSLTPGLP